MEGWRCPSCGRCYSPYVTECGHCPVQTLTSAGTFQPASVVPPDQCPDCGGPRRLPGGTGCRSGSHWGPFSIQSQP